MGDGLIQFLVVAVFVIISMMDGAARKRRKQAQSLARVPYESDLRDFEIVLTPTDGLRSASRVVRMRWLGPCSANLSTRRVQPG